MGGAVGGGDGGAGGWIQEGVKYELGVGREGEQSIVSKKGRMTRKSYHVQGLSVKQ